MATQDDIIETTVIVGGAAIGRAGFGTAIAVDAASMAERIRFYTTPGAVAADLAAGDITAAQATHLSAALSQRRKPARVAAARALITLTAQVTTVTVGGTPTSGDYTIEIDGTEFTFTRAGAEDNDDIAQELRDLINAGPIAVTASGATADVIITSDYAGVAFTVDTTAPVGATLAAVATTPNANNASSELDAILAESADWYGLHLVSRSAAQILAAAAWAETNNRFHAPQTSDADAISAGTSDIASALNGLNLAYTKMFYYSVDATPFAFLTLTQQLTADPDTDTVPPLGLIQLSGITAQDSVISETQRTIARTKRVMTYLTLKKVAATDGAPDASRMTNGVFADARIIADWLRERSNENIAALLLNLRAQNKKVGFNDRGFQQLGSVVEALLRQGIDNDNFDDAIDPDTDEVISPRVFLPLRATSPQSEVDARQYTFTSQAALSGAVGIVRQTVTITDDLALLTQLLG